MTPPDEPPRGLEPSPVVDSEFDPGIKLVEKPDGVYLHIALDKAWAGVKSLTDQSESGCGREFARTGVFTVVERKESPRKSIVLMRGRR